jgi:hypothetical protein
VAGDGKGYFRPSETVSRAEAVVMMCLLANRPPDPSSNMPFRDVSADEWYAPFVGAANAGGCLPPEWGPEFQPFAGLKRVEATSMAVRVSQLSPYTPKQASFGDVACDSPHWLDVETAVYHGLVFAGGLAHTGEP